MSARKHNPFIAVNCGAIPEGTIDSELFGHEKGSFTGAVESRKGYFETVNGGTIFLDEIGEMPLGTQARLLRVLETGEYIRVGSSKVQKTDVRVIAATNKDLLEYTHKGKFREDLYYRLNTVPIRVPALRDRKEDIVLLFRKFATDFAERAVDLDYKFAWNGYNMLAITKLIRDGEGITDYEDAEAAAGVKQSFYTNLATTRNSLESFIIPKQSHELGALIISQVVEKDSDTIKQCLFILKSYEKISKHLESLMETVAKADGDEMIRPSRMYGAEELLAKVDAKDLEEG
jgi:hypothetical protein